MISTLTKVFFNILVNRVNIDNIYIYTYTYIYIKRSNHSSNKELTKYNFGRV